MSHCPIRKHEHVRAHGLVGYIWSSPKRTTTGHLNSEQLAIAGNRGFSLVCIYNQNITLNESLSPFLFLTLQAIQRQRFCKRSMQRASCKQSAEHVVGGTPVSGVVVMPRQLFPNSKVLIDQE